MGLITGYGKTRESWDRTDVKAAVTQLLVEEMSVPVAQKAKNKGVVYIDRGAWRQQGGGPPDSTE